MVHSCLSLIQKGRIRKWLEVCFLCLWCKNYTWKPHNILGYVLSQRCSLLFPHAGSSQQVIWNPQEMSVCFKYTDTQLPGLQHLAWSLQWPSESFSDVMYAAGFQRRTAHSNCKLMLQDESFLWGTKHFGLDSDLLFYGAKITLCFVF